VRGRLVAERTALINQLRALMLERGIAVPQGLERLGIDQQSPANRSIAISVKPSTAAIVLF
jgi:transposase